MKKEGGMKMCGLGCGIFWGVLLILIGFIIIMNIVLGIRIPVLRLLVALILIYLGIMILLGAPSRRKEKITIVKTKEKIDTVRVSERYDIIFGEQEIDLTKVKLDDEWRGVNIDVVFGKSVVKINRELPTKIIVSAAFSSVTLPDGNKITFGTNTYKTGSFNESMPYLLLRIGVVFGSMDIIEISPPKEQHIETPDSLKT